MRSPRDIKIGDRFVLEKGPVTTVQLVMYAGASGDFNRIHYDLPFAQEAGLGGVIAHGMLTMGFATQLLGEVAGPGGLVRKISARFMSPVRPGDKVRLEAIVDALKDTRDAPAIALSYSGFVGDKQVIGGEGEILLLSAA